MEIYKKTTLGNLTLVSGIEFWSVFNQLIFSSL